MESHRGRGDRRAVRDRPPPAGGVRR